jgi:hypothetical protein
VEGLHAHRPRAAAGRRLDARARVGPVPAARAAPGVELALARADVAHAMYPSDAVAASAVPRPLVFSYMGLPDAAYLDERRGRRWTMEAGMRPRRRGGRAERAAAAAFGDVLGVQARRDLAGCRPCRVLARREPARADADDRLLGRAGRAA